MKNTVLTFFTLCFCLITSAQEDSGSFKDNRDGQTYATIEIGNQVWMTENLNVDQFRNGDSIPEAKTWIEWYKAFDDQQPAWCYYDFDSANGEKYGKLYNWYAVNDPRGLAPKGWHVPSVTEWTMLIDFLGGEDVAGTKMKSTSGWQGEGNGTNESGFLGLPGGFCSFRGAFFDLGKIGYFWSSTEHNENSAWGINLGRNDSSVVGRTGSKSFGFSVRCVKD